MQDASAAESGAARIVFGSNIIILMCWFHVMYNVAKHLTKDIKIYEKMVKTDIGALHYCTTVNDFNNKKMEIWFKWTSYPTLVAFANYFRPVD